MGEIVEGRLFARITAKQLGVSRSLIQGHLAEMDRERPIDDGRSVETLAVEVMARCRAANANAWCQADEVGFDFEGLLEFIANLLPLIMPLIIKRRA